MVDLKYPKFNRIAAMLCVAAMLAVAPACHNDSESFEPTLSANITTAEDVRTSSMSNSSTYNSSTILVSTNTASAQESTSVTKEDTTATVQKTITTTQKQTPTKNPPPTTQKVTTKTTAITTTTVKIVTAADVKTIADKTIEYINQYRVAEGSVAATKLPGLTQVAEYRSKQLVTNFAHDTKDIREAYAFYKYGFYRDATLYGDPPEYSYYDGPGREAIGQCSGLIVGGAEGVARRLADGVHNSTLHWSYVGSTEYPYIAVGVTVSDGVWYCCVYVTADNTYG